MLSFPSASFLLTLLTNLCAPSLSASPSHQETLSYQCVCQVNGLSPNVSEYSLTIPYYICTETNNQCVRACGINNNCANNCRTKNPCGAQSPTRVTTTATSATATPTNSGSSSDLDTFGGDGNFASDGANNSGEQTMLDIGRTYGAAVIVTGALCAFGLML